MEKRVIAGLLLFFGFIFNVATIIFLIVDIVELPDPQDSFQQAVLDEAYFALGLTIVFAVIVLVGAMSSLMGWKWGVSLAGAIICVLSFGIFFLATICGIVAVILLAVGKKDFEPRVVYVDESAYGYGAPQEYGYDPGYDDGYYEGGDGYGGYEAQAQQAPPIQLVDQYGAAQEHQYDESQQRYK
jgi:hypothetical protein